MSNSRLEASILCRGARWAPPRPPGRLRSFTKAGPGRLAARGKVRGKAPPARGTYWYRGFEYPSMALWPERPYAT